MLLQGSFYHKGKKFKLTLTESWLAWEQENSPQGHEKILVSEIISCWICVKGSYTCAPDVTDVSGETSKSCPHFKKDKGGLSIEMSTRRGNQRWTKSVLVFLHVAMEVVNTWYEAIWTVINRLKERPNKLVVVINPVGGRKKACTDFYKKVYPIFKRAWIHTQVFQTKYKGHGTHIVEEAASKGELKDCDGIVAVGGDGLVSEIVTGLFVVASDSQGINHNDADVDFPSTQIRLGVIPCGSTDATCFATHGSSDIVTAALHIVMGDKRYVDVASIHADGKLHRVVTTLISYGYFGDLMRSSEHLRCLGPPRYILSGVQQVLRNRSYPVELSFKKRKPFIEGEEDSSDSDMQSTLSCSSICTVCSHIEDNVDYGNSTEEDWQTVEGSYSIVSAAITSCSCRLTPQGVSPLAHLGDGYCDLILVKGSSRVKLLSYLYHTSVTGNAANLNHVKMIRTNEIRFSAPPDCLSSFNCDGEELEKASLRIKIHRQKLELFCRGVENKIVEGSPNSGRKRGRDSVDFVGNGENGGVISC